MRKDNFSEESLIELGKTKSEESLKFLLKYVKKREKYAVKEVAYESIEKLCPVAGDKLRESILNFMNKELNSVAVSKVWRFTPAPVKELQKKTKSIVKILAFFKDKSSIAPLLVRYSTYYDKIIWPMFSGSGEFEKETKHIIEAIRKIANNADDDFTKAIIGWKCNSKWGRNVKPKTNRGGTYLEPYSSDRNTTLKIVFCSLLACTEDLNRLNFLIENGTYNREMFKDFCYGYPMANELKSELKIHKRSLELHPDEKEAYDIVSKNASKENIANLIKIMLSSTHPIYKSYYKNMGGKDDDPRKFLLDDDPSMQLMGIAMAKGVGYPKGIQHILLDLALFSKEEAVRESALEGVKNAGIENIPFPKLKDLASENIQLIRKKNKNKTIASAIISMGDLRGLEYLQEIFKNSNKKTANSIIDGVLTFLDEEECVIFYDDLLKEICHDKNTAGLLQGIPGGYYAKHINEWLDKTSIFRLQLPRGLPRLMISNTRAEGTTERLNSIFSGYAKIGASEKQNIIFKFAFQMSFEMVFWSDDPAMVRMGISMAKRVSHHSEEDRTDIKNKIPSMDKFVKTNIKNSYKLDDLTTLKNLEKYILSNFTAAENKIQEDSQYDSSLIHKCMQKAAEKCLRIISSSHKEHRVRISKMLEYVREDKEPLSAVEDMTITRDVKGLIAILSSVDSSSGVDKNSDVEAAVTALGNIKDKKAIQPLIDIYYLDDTTIDLDISGSILWALHQIAKKHNMNPDKNPLNHIEGLRVCPRCDEWYDYYVESPSDDGYCELCIVRMRQ